MSNQGNSKFHQFVYIPMEKKSVETIPGIGPSYGDLLRGCDYYRAHELYRAHLNVNRKATPFYDLMRAIKIPDNTTETVIQAFNAYYRQHGRNNQS